MGRLSPEWEHEHDQEAVSRETASPPPVQEASVRSLAWASAIGNQAVQRLARRTRSPQAVEDEEEVDESTAVPPAVEDAAPPAGEAPREDAAPEEAEDPAALDELPEEELAE